VIDRDGSVFSRTPSDKSCVHNAHESTACFLCERSSLQTYPARTLLAPKKPLTDNSEGGLPLRGGHLRWFGTMSGTGSRGASSVASSTGTTETRHQRRSAQQLAFHGHLHKADDWRAIFKQVNRTGWDERVNSAQSISFAASRTGAATTQRFRDRRGSSTAIRSHRAVNGHAPKHSRAGIHFDARLPYPELTMRRSGRSATASTISFPSV